MKELLGKKINRIFVATDDESIYFDTDSGIVSYVADADCCSETFISNIMTNYTSNIKAVLGGVVTDVVEMPNDQGMSTKQEEDIVYGYELHIRPEDKIGRYGDVIEMPETNILFITYRNSSNGYYGGSLEYKDCESIPYDANEITKPYESSFI